MSEEVTAPEIVSPELVPVVPESIAECAEIKPESAPEITPAVLPLEVSILESINLSTLIVSTTTLYYLSLCHNVNHHVVLIIVLQYVHFI